MYTYRELTFLVIMAISLGVHAGAVVPRLVAKTVWVTTDGCFKQEVSNKNGKRYTKLPIALCPTLAKTEPEVVIETPPVVTPPIVVIPPAPSIRRVSSSPWAGNEVLPKLPNGDCYAEVNGAIYSPSYINKLGQIQCYDWGI